MQGVVLLLALASVSMGALAQGLFKAGMSGPGVRAAIEGGAPVPILLAVLLSPFVLGGLALYGLGTVLWLAVLSRAELSQAYPLVGLSFVLTALMGWLVFADALTPLRLAGIALIVAGVILVGRN